MSLLAPASAALRLAARPVRWILALALLAWGLLLAAWLALHWAILPHIDKWRPELETLASRALGQGLSIGTIEARSSGWIPAVELRDVRLLDPAGREALHLPRVVAALSAHSLWALELRFEQLLIEQPELVVRRDAQGRILVAGHSVDPEGAASSSGEASEALADWFFSQREFVIRRGRVRWVDEQRAAPPLELAGLDLVVRNGLRRHELRLDATPPPGWGQRFSLRGRFTQSLLKRPGELRHWSGQLYADLPRVDVRALRHHLDLPFELDEGDGALRAWFEVKAGQAQGLTLDMGLRAVRLRLDAAAEPLLLSQVEGRLALARQPQGFSLTATGLGFKGADGLAWPRSDWHLAVREPRARSGLLPAAPGGGEISAQQLDLALLAQIAGRLRLSEAQRKQLTELAPQGRVQSLQASWEGALARPAKYQLKAELKALRLAARPGAEPGHAGRPGLAGLDLQLQAGERGGQAKLSLQDGILSFPGLFDEPELPLSRLSTQLDWRIEPRPEGRPPALELRVSDLRLANADLRGEFNAVWKTGADGAARLPGQLDLSGRIDQVAATRVQRYLPLVVGTHARDYVRDAVQGGLARQLQFRVRGDLAEFPFDKAPQRGQFRISTLAQDVKLAYVPGEAGAESPWPGMEKVSAELVFERGSMQIRQGRAQVLGYELTGVTGGFKDLMQRRVLELEGQGRGPAAELLRFVKASPVDRWTGGVLKDTSATGAAALRLQLALPLADVNQGTVKGQVLLAANDVRLRPDMPLLGNARARIEFDQRGLSIHGGAARVLGGDASFEGGNQRDGSLRFTAQGLATAEALRRAPELGLLSKLAQSLNGQAAYRLQLGYPKEGGSEFLLNSTLQGLSAELPAPLAKAAESPLPLRYQALAQPGGREELRLELGQLLQAHYLRDTSAEPARVLAGSLGLGAPPPPLPAQGVQMQAQLGQVSLDAWMALLQRWQGGGASGSSGAAPAMLEGGYAPSQIALRAQGLQVLGRPLTQVVAGISHLAEPGAWQLNLDAEQLGGHIEWRAGRGAGQAGRLHARLARLSLPKNEAEGVTHLLDQPAANPGSPGQVPALDIVVEDFELRGKRLGRLEVQAQAQGPLREWRLNRLQLSNADAVFSASGQWLTEAGRAQRRMLLDCKLDVLNAGQLLERLGQGRVLKGGKGQVSGPISWLGSPLALDYPSLAGKLHVELDAGQFLQAEPGVGRLLGILSLQSLPRRLVLDFRDVFSEGFAFDGFAGDVLIERGVASSQNLRMVGVQAVVAMEGRTDLARETQDLRVLVVPEINAGGAALAYAAINPVVGLGTFLAQWVLRQPMMAASTREFHVTGTWDDPKVEKVERKSEAVPPAASATVPPTAQPGVQP